MNSKIRKVFWYNMLEKSGAWLEGDFLLKEGNRSDRFFDGKKFILSATRSHFVARDFLFWLRRRENGVVNVVGISNGGIPIIGAMAVYNYNQWAPHNYCYILDEEKSHGIESIYQGNMPIPDAPVALVDDVGNTGSSLFAAKKTLEDDGYKVKYAMLLATRGRDLTFKLNSSKIETYSIYRQFGGSMLVNTLVD